MSPSPAVTAEGHAPLIRTSSGRSAPSEVKHVTSADEPEPTAITRLAEAAVAAIAHGLASGRDPAETVARVLAAVFAGGEADADVVARVLRIIRGPGE